MKTKALPILIAWLLLSSFTSSEFSTPELERRYWSLAKELRCLVCQNQSLADSNSALAGDLRQILFEQLQEGKTDQQIQTFLIERYGDYVLYDPPFRLATLALWLGPALLLLLGLWMLIRTLANQPKTDHNT